METSFKKFKNLKVIRCPFSYLMILEYNNKVWFYKKDIIKNRFYSQNKSLDEDEKKLIIND